MNYSDFIATKEKAHGRHGIEPTDLSDVLYPFQQDIVRWALRKGRAAIFADCGLGKTLMQLEWARRITDGPRLIAAPLAVADQTIREAEKLGLPVEYVTAPSDAPYQITNYERLSHFVGHEYGALVLDESSILKSIDGKIRTMILEEFTSIPYRLACTATPAPNDVSELANHAQFVGAMDRVEMLATFFVHDSERSGASGWRLKGHGEDSFWRWCATWSVYVRQPSDIGHKDGAFVLPSLEVSDRIVQHEMESSEVLFPEALPGGLERDRLARRSSLAARVEAAADIIDDCPDQFIVWCGLNDEGRDLAGRLPSSVLVEGATSPHEKIELERKWRAGEVQTIITKPSIFGFGMNWQHCHRQIFLGIGHSFEQYYQAIRRSWRFGQPDPVRADIVISTYESRVAELVRRKERDASEMAARIVDHMKSAMIEEVRGEAVTEDREYQEDEFVHDGARMLLGDSVTRIAEIETGSVGVSVFSPPFASLYTYSASDRDLGNSADYDEFFEHFDYLIPEILRVTMPGRRCCVHVQQVTTTKVTHGVIGWRDFRADTVRHFVDAGWVYDGEVVIDKDPQAQAIRTKSKALMFTQKNKDSSWSRPAMADYILLFRHPGENPTPIKTDVSNEEWIQWARPIWYGIRESETLNAAEARTDKDERHICPLQLETIERCVRLWSNPGDLVFSPFAGIGSEGYVALKHERQFTGIELKPEYYKAACRNLREATAQLSLF